MPEDSKHRRIRLTCDLFRVLSDETRIRLLLALRSGELHVSELCNRLKLPQPTVSHHLGLLRIHGLVRPRRQGKQVFYSVSPEKFAGSRDTINAILQ